MIKNKIINILFYVLVFLFGQIYTFYINRIVDKIVFLGVQNRQKWKRNGYLPIFAYKKAR